MNHFTLSRLSVHLLLLLTLLAPTAPALGQCSPLHLGVPNVTVELLTGDPGSTDRREHAILSTGLVQALGLTGRIDPAEDVNPQVRVTVTAVTGAPQADPRTTANFTAAGTFTDSALILRVYPQKDPGDEDSGEWKLIGEINDQNTNPNPTPIGVGDLTVTAFPLAPSRTTIVDGANTFVFDNFCEPAGNDPATASFVETADVGAVDKQVVVLTPHGGDIEGDTSDMAGRLVQRLANLNVDADSWDAAGEWPDDTSERWHITATAVDPSSFPGLAQVFAEPDYQTGVPYRYSVAYHGMRLDSPAVLLGGQANLEEKCWVTRRMQDALDAEEPGSAGDVAFYLADVDDHEISLPDRQGRRVEGERSVSGVRGLSDDNVVNRLSPNDGDPEFGAFQVEISNGLRDEQFLMDAVSDGLGLALAELIANPSVAAGACDALAARTEVEVEADELISFFPVSEQVRREQAWISRGLADLLGITDADVTGGSARPQIRVVVDAPRVPGTGIANAATFTVTQIQAGTTPSIAVHARSGTFDTIAGAHQLTVGFKTGTGVQDLERVLAYRVVPSRSELTMIEADDLDDVEELSIHGPAEPTGHTGRIREEARLVDDREVLVAFPFVGDDTGVFQPLDEILVGLEEVDDLHGSFWRYDADWTYGLTFDRWFVSRSSFGSRSLPILDHLLADENDDTDTPFRYVLAAEPFDTSDFEVIVGGQADRTEKCYLVHEMQASLTAAGLGGSVAFHVEDPGGDVPVPDASSHSVPAAVAALYAGLDPEDVQNRLSPNPARTAGQGAFLVAEGDALLASVPHRNALGNGLGTALGHLADGGVPGGFSCSSL
jgi:phage replication-related protein YjqB (UPF0714/DUF867 family)